MRKTVLTAVAGIGMAALSPAANASVTIVNGSFENGAVDPGGFFTPVASGDSTSIAGWTVGGSGVDYIGGYWQPEDGKRSIDLSGGAPGSISQLISGLTSGQVYDISFWLSGNPDGGSTTKVGTVSGGTAQSFSYTLSGTNSLSNMNWKEFHYVFTALGATALLTFSSGTGDAYGPALDNVSIAAVPEPATWGMMILGFGLAGGAMRRRSRKLATA